LEDSAVFLIDSLNRLTEFHDSLIASNALYLRLLTGQLSETAFLDSEQELIGSWRLYLKPMQLAGGLYKSGLISYNPFTVPDSIQMHNIYKIDFLPEELANIYFKDGRKQKCFYKVDEFNKGQPFSITYARKDEFELTMHMSPMPGGMEVSYEIPIDSTQVLYFNGVMKP